MYDILILGAGPAGLTAGLYASRAKLKVGIIEKAIEGGQISGTSSVENYPGIIEISGMDLGLNMREQAENFGCEFINDEVLSVDLKGQEKKVKGKYGEYEARSIIITTGASHRKIGVEGESEFTGRGVSYCATCDAAFYEDLDVYVVGGGDSAVEEALFITKFAKTVTIIHRRDSLRASKSLQEKAFNNDKIKFIWDSEVVKIEGENIVEALTLKNTKTGEITKIESEEPFGIFVFIGLVPTTKLFESQLSLEDGYILADEDMKTSIDGVYAAGDVRKKKVRQVATAVGDGCIAAISAEKYLNELDGTLYEGFKK
ncbi:thioredoxin-disulfide reductase [Peptoniphilus duerdenii]|uniref:thioredoxin-disulfide reductase n=1 Tax=Peptoniphilus duerdenii TaxID=507750 RepID=UPI00254FC971|nr:thioredoxin-disulfide reductase [Peptoniphilus duerdenii]MDK8276328.1 thioredoxin-disulfide reductase [Peptoniphilus duerdenii]